MRTVQLKSRTVLRSRDPPSTLFVFLIISLIFCTVFLIVHGVPRVSCDWGRWWRNVAQGALVADSGNLGGCTHTCRTRVIEGFLHMHVSPAPALDSHWAQLETLLSPAAAAERLTLARAKHARDGRP